jgi:DNA polymerase IV
MQPIRKIIHIDMDAFYASIEQRDFPEYKGKPLAVGGSKERGVVAAASYEARKFGIHSAMASKIAYQKCPQVIFVKPRFEVYKQVSTIIMDIFHEYTELVEPLSLDEAYLDVTYCKKDIPTATLIAREIKNRINETTGLTASAGVSFNKFLAKTASDINKPDGLTVVTPDLAEDLLNRLKIEKFHGIGKVTAARLKSMGVHTGAQLKELSLAELIRLFGKSGKHFYEIVRLEDYREVQPNRETKSVGAENTFEKDLTDFEEMWEELKIIADSVQKRLQRKGLSGRTITVKIKHFDFTQKTRSQTLNSFVGSAEEILPVVAQLMEAGNYLEKPVRLLGISISNFPGEANFTGQLCFDF